MSKPIDKRLYNIYIDLFTNKEPCFNKPMTICEAEERLSTYLGLYKSLKDHYYIDIYNGTKKGY